MNVQSKLSSLVTIPGQCFLLVVSSLIILYLFQAPLRDFNPVGRTSFVLPVTPGVTTSWGKEPARVKTGLMVYEFIKFEPTKNDFLMSGIIWFEFDPTKVKQETIDKFAFNKGDITQKSDPVIKKISDTATYVQYHFRVQFSALFDYSLFPFDDHIVSLNLINDSIEATNMIYEVAPPDFTIPPYLFLSGWKIIKHEVKYGYNELTLSEKSLAEKSKVTLQPKAVFSFHIKKEEVRLLILMLLPLLVLFYLSLFTLSMKDFTLGIDSIILLVTAFMASAIVTQGMSPDVNYFMVIDYLTIFFLLTIFFTFFIDFLGQSSQEYISTDMHEAIKGVSVIVLHIALIMMIYYVTHI